MARTPRQAADATVSWTVDWSEQLTAVGVTITAATVTCATVGVAIGGVSNTTTSVSFQLSGVDVVSPPVRVPIVVTATLSNGDTDVRTVPILLT